MQNRVQQEICTELKVGSAGLQAGVPASGNVLLFFDVFITQFGVTRFLFRFMLTD